MVTMKQFYRSRYKRWHFRAAVVDVFVVVVVFVGDDYCCPSLDFVDYDCCPNHDYRSLTENDGFPYSPNSRRASLPPNLTLAKTSRQRHHRRYFRFLTTWHI